MATTPALNDILEAVQTRADAGSNFLQWSVGDITKHNESVDLVESELIARGFRVEWAMVKTGGGMFIFW